MVLSMFNFFYQIKNKIPNLIYPFIICTMVNPELKAQDAIFSQIYNNNLYHNPAFAGMIDMASVSGVYRRQSIGTFNNPGFVTYGAAYLQPSKFLHGGAGLQIIRDMQ